MLSKTDFNLLPAKWKRWRWYLSTYHDLTIKFVGQRAVVIADTLSRQQLYLYQSSSNTLRVVGAINALTSEGVQDLTDKFYASPWLQRLAKEQQEDEWMQDVKKRISERDPLAVDYYIDKGEYKGILRRRQKINADSEIIHQFVVPKSMVNDVLLTGHSSHFGGGHRGRDKTKQRILQRFYWASMDSDIADYIKKCEGCQLAKANFKPYDKEPKTRISTDIFETISLDVLELSVPSNSFKHILVVQDLFSRYLVLIPIKTQTAAEMAAVIYERIVANYGVPVNFLSDNHKSFVKILSEKLRDLLGTNAVFTYSRWPQGNGANERSHRSIMHMLKVFCSSKQSEWTRYLPSIQWVLNTSALPGTGLTPYDILYGKRPRLFNNALLLSATQLGNVPSPPTNLEAIQIFEMARDIRTLLNEVRFSATSRVKAKEAFEYDDFQPGDRVILFYRNSRRSKHLTRGIGPCTIVSKESNGSFTVKHDLYPQTLANIAPANMQLFFDQDASAIEHSDPLGEKDDKKKSKAIYNKQRKRPIGEQTDSTGEQAIKEKRVRLDKGHAVVREPVDIGGKELQLDVEENDFCIYISPETKKMYLARAISVDAIGFTVDLHFFGNPPVDHGSTKSVQIPLRDRVWRPAWENTQTGEVIFTNRSDVNLKAQTQQVELCDIVLKFKKLSEGQYLGLGVLNQISRLVSNS